MPKFVYFGGKEVEKKQAVLNALTATSFFTYFVKNDLRNLFEEEGIEDIYTRIGIDFGYDELILNKMITDHNQGKMKFPDQRKVVTSTFLRI